MTIEDRQRWVSDFTSTYSPQFFINDWFNNIRGVLGFAKEKQLVENSAWFSMVDAGILQGIQEGMARATHVSSGKCSLGESACNPGGARWEAFFMRAQAIGHPATTRAEGLALRELWGPAEQQSTDYGRFLAEVGSGLRPTTQERTLLIDVGDMYRHVVANPGDAPDALTGLAMSATCAGTSAMWGAVESISSLWGGQTCSDRAQRLVYNAFDPRNADTLRLTANLVWSGVGALQSLGGAMERTYTYHGGG
jgi:hypothetical protein